MTTTPAPATFRTRDIVPGVTVVMGHDLVLVAADVRESETGGRFIAWVPAEDGTRVRTYGMHHPKETLDDAVVLATAEQATTYSRLMGGVTVDQHAVLGHLEAAWRVAAASHDTALYNVVADTLTTVLMAALGAQNGREVREQMADNFESWTYNVGVIAARRDFEAGYCDQCGGTDGQHFGC